MDAANRKLTDNAAAAAARRIRDRAKLPKAKAISSFSVPPMGWSDPQISTKPTPQPISAQISVKSNVEAEKKQDTIDYSLLAKPAESTIVYAQPPRDLQSLKQITGDRPASGDELDEGLKPITAVGVSIRPEVGELPTDFAATRFARVGQMRQPMGASRQWGHTTKVWEAPGLCHRPLRFEEVNLERYGYSAGVLQPAISAAHFFGTLPLLPYSMSAKKPWQCEYTLGHYRPGSYAPFRLHRPPLRLDATTMQGLVTTGAFFLFP